MKKQHAGLHATLLESEIEYILSFDKHAKETNCRPSASRALRQIIAKLGPCDSGPGKDEVRKVKKKDSAHAG